MFWLVMSMELLLSARAMNRVSALSKIQTSFCGSWFLWLKNLCNLCNLWFLPIRVIQNNLCNAYRDRRP
jgi:hypothetical protein